MKAGTAGLVLQLPQPQQMVDPLLVRLDVSVEHRAMRRDAEPVRRAMRVEPKVGMLLAGSDEATLAGRRRSQLRHRVTIEPGVTKVAQDLLVQPSNFVM